MRSENIRKYIDRDVFGGSVLRNGYGEGTRAKKRRPLQHGEWLHVCMRSKVARGSKSMLKPGTKQVVARIVDRTAAKAGIRISSWQNVGNHLHFSIKVPNRRAYNRWIRGMSGLIARAVTGSERGVARGDESRGVIGPKNREAKSNKRIPFWEARPYTRVVRGFDAFDRLAFYIRKNRLEAMGYTTKRAKEIVRMMAVKQAYLDQIAPIDISNAPPG